MSLIDRILRFFRKKHSVEALQSASTALQSDAKALESASKRFEAPYQALESAKVLENLMNTQQDKQRIEPSTIELQKESLQLGVAAGYVGRSLKEIENSLLRIETQMVTKDWFNIELKEKISKLLEIAQQHEKDEEERFKALQSALNQLRVLAAQTQEPVKTEIFRQIETIESKLPLTSKMAEVLTILQEVKEISYKDLAHRLGVSVSSLRGLLTNMAKRTNEIERFSKDGQGWVRLKST